MSATTVALIAVGVAVVAAAVGTVATVQASRQQANLQKGIKKQKEQEAITAEETAEFNERQHRRKIAMLLGQQRAGFAAGGYDVEGGTPLAFEIDLVKEGELEALAIKREGAIAGGERRFEAGVAQFARRAAIRQQPLQIAGGVLGAAASGISTYSTVSYRQSQGTRTNPSYRYGYGTEG